jgi:chromate transporter
VVKNPHPTFREALRFWLKLGFISFGGPTGQIAIMHAELVERKKWIGGQRFLHALNYSMLLPGPEATQLAIYCGWLLHRTWGGIAAGVLFVLPSVFILWGLSYVYVTFGTLPWIAAIFHGLQPAVTAIVAAAVIRLGQRALQNGVGWGIAVASFVAIYLFKIPFPLIVLGAALVGWGWNVLSPTRSFESAQTSVLGTTRSTSVIDDADALPAHMRPSLARAGKVLTISLVLWWAPVVAAGLWQGWDGTLAREGIFFSKAATVTFGGAYAVLPYVGQQAVAHFDWLTAPQMLDGLGLAETTPGPLIIVVQFVGFLGGWHHPGALGQLAAATLGALMTTWTTFVPCFLWIFLGAPYLERLRDNTSLARALAGVTAAVVGVVLNLAVWFGLHVLWPHQRISVGLAPGLPFFSMAGTGGVDGFAVVLMLAAFLAIQRFKVGMIPIVLASGALGLVWSYVA